MSSCTERNRRNTAAHHGDAVTRTCLILVLLLGAGTARAEDVAALISQYRQGHGLAAVKTDARLTRIAEQQARAMAAKNLLDHDADGAFATRIGALSFNQAAENIAVGTSTWAETLRLWEGSSGHDANLRLPGATHVGVAVARSGKRAFWAMEIADETPPARKSTHVHDVRGFALPDFLQRLLTR